MRGALILAWLIAALAPAARAQTGEAIPEIVLPAPEIAQPAEPETQPGVQAETGRPDAAQGSAPATPEISPEVPPAEAFAPPPDRDGPSDPAAADPVWLMPLGPAAPLPRGVHMGASLPAPDILRLTGEVAATGLILLLPPGAEPPDHLRLTLRSGVNVLPDSAALHLAVNGGPPVAVPLTHAGEFATVDVPVTSLKPGENRIEINVVQPHRIFCGPDASFAVWTEIALARSGAAVPSAAIGTDAPGFSLAVAAGAMRGSRIRILADPATPTPVLQAISAALADALGGTAQVSLRSFYDPPEGDLALVAAIAADTPRLSFRRGASGAIVLQVEYAGETAPDLSGLLPVTSVAAGISPPLLTPGRAVPFTELGQADFTGNTHYFQADVPFRLPDDWLLLANQKARLTLHYGFANALAQGSILLVKMNGATVRLLPLDRAGGKIQPPLAIDFPAGLLHAGANALSFEMMVPGQPADAACEARRADMLVILGDSALDVPTSPAMRQPGLGVALRDLGRNGVVAAPDAPDAPRLKEAAVALTGMLAPAGEKAGPTRLSLLTVAGAARAPLDAAGLSVPDVQKALFPPPATPEAGAPATGPRFVLDDGAATPATEPLSDWLWSGVRRFFTAEGWVARKARRLRQAAFLGSDQTLAGWLGERTGVALLLQPDPAAPGDLWLILAPAIDGATAAAAVEDLRRTGIANGQAALLDAAGTWHVWTSLAAPEMLEPARPTNLRSMLGNYASWSPLLFTLAMLGLALASTIPALLLLILTRKRRNGP